MGDTEYLQLPDHPLVNETIRDCLTEAMDIDGLESLLRDIEQGRVSCVARDLPEPSPLAHEILNARPYAFLDDAPLEERRTQAVYTRRAGEAASGSDLGRLDAAAIDRVCREMIPAVVAEGLADAVDAFCEGIGFTPAQTRKVFDAARAHGLPVKLHAEQLSNLHGAALAAEFGALSADHLEHLDQAGVDAMARAGTVATLLPGAYYFVRETQTPPIAALRAAGVPLALATDCNPGTSPLTSILLVMNMAATLFRLTVDECLIGVTRAAAGPLGLSDRGTLETDKRCDLAIWNAERPAELVYGMGLNPLHARVWEGQ